MKQLLHGSSRWADEDLIERSSRMRLLDRWMDGTDARVVRKSAGAKANTG
jgi:hypothetical protein